MTKVWAHRGASGYYPENTISSFEGAIKQNADGIELDVHLSKDGYLIVCHDETLNRTTNGKGFIKQYDLYELKQLDAGSWYDKKFKGEKIPLLEEVIDLIKGTKMELNIELKAGSIFYPVIEEKVLKMVDKYGIKKQVIISSFDHYSLVKIKDLDKDIKTGILYMEALYKPLDYVKTTKANALHPNYITLTKDIVDEAKAIGIDVNPYTINNEEHVRMIKPMNVNAIITNYPDKVKAILSE